MFTDSILNAVQAVGRKLSAQHKTLTVAESCTGGGLAFALTAIDGSSAYFDRGYVTYSNAAKEACLDVPAALIARFGAVSEAAVKAMAVGALARSGAHYALSISGIAGPQGGSADKPVGSVCFGFASDQGVIEAYSELFAGDRSAIRLAAIAYALGLLNEKLS